jgi:hypothetical protein
MNNPINIIDNNKQIELSPGAHHLNILGGWNVNTGNFSIILRELGGDIKIKSKDIPWRIQSFSFGKRVKKIASVEVPKKAIYEIEFLNATEVKVKKSNLIMLSVFQKNIPTNKIQIYIE